MHKNYLYCNIITNNKNLNIIIFNKKNNIYIILNFKYLLYNNNKLIKKMILYFMYQNGLKCLYLSQWYLFGIKNNLITNLLQI